MTAHLKALQSVRTPEGRRTFQDVVKWLASYQDQKDGPPCADVCKGVPYVEFASAYTCRDAPLDREIGEAYCVADFTAQVEAYMEEHEGTLYWREPFEWDAWKGGVVTCWMCTRKEYVKNEDEAKKKIAEAGAELDLITDNWGVIDERFVTIKCYARLAITKEQPQEVDGLLEVLPAAIAWAEEKIGKELRELKK